LLSACQKIEDFQTIEPYIGIMVDFPSQVLVDTWLNNDSINPEHAEIILDSFFNITAWLREYLNFFCEDSNGKSSILLERLAQLTAAEMTLSKIVSSKNADYQPPRHHNEDSKLNSNPFAKSSSSKQGIFNFRIILMNIENYISNIITYALNYDAVNINQLILFNPHLHESASEQTHSIYLEC
jgi:hypothetical protein